MRHYLFAFLLVLAVLAAAPASARDMVFGLSPHQSKDALQSQVEQSLLHAAETLAPGGTAHFFDASAVRLIGTFEAPDRKGYDNARARLQVNREVVGALKRFLDSAEAVPGRTGASNWPALFELLRTAYPAQESTALILLGSPIVHGPRATSVSMLGARVPNDGHIAATAGQSPYGTSGLVGSLEGYDVYFGIIGAPYAVSTSHGFAVERFWTLSADAHGANATYFGRDLATLFRLATSPTPEQAIADPLVPTDKLEMLTFAPDNGTLPDLYRARPVEAPAPEPLWQGARAVTIGATWDQEVDVDLYVRPAPGAEVVFYGNANTADGRLYKDLTVNPGLAFETVALSAAPVDLSQVDIALNLYSGQVPNGVIGELRIAIDEDVWATPFRIAATTGNRGAGGEAALVERIVPNDAWVLIDPMAVIGAE